MGSYDQGASLCLSPRHPEELGSPPGWYGHSHPEGITFYPEHFASDTVRDRDGNRDWDRVEDGDGDREKDRKWKRDEHRDRNWDGDRDGLWTRPSNGDGDRIRDKDAGRGDCQV